MQQLLGLAVGAPAATLRIVRPLLPPELERLELRRLDVDSGELRVEPD